MTCPKCKTNDQWGNFCSNCGNQLKEKCPECGKMEWIGKKICLTAIEKAKKTKEEFFERNGLSSTSRGRIFFLIPFAGSSIWGMGIIVFLVLYAAKALPMSLLFLETHPVSFLLVFFTTALTPGIVYFFIAEALWKRKEKKLETEFPIQHPKETELLKKAEEK